MRPRYRPCALTLAAGLAAGRLCSLPLAAAETPAILIQPAAPPSPERLVAMRRWHDRYRTALTPALAAWSGAGRDLERWYYRGSAPGCQALARTLAAVDAGSLLPAPEYGLSRDLDALLEGLARGAAACLVGRYFEASYELGEARGVYLGLVRRLGRYGLEP